MDETTIMAVLDRLEQGQLEQRREAKELRQETQELRRETQELRQETLKFWRETQEFRREVQELRQEVTAMRVDLMAKFERIENRMAGLEAGLASNLEQVGGILDQLTARESQLALLQDAIRSGINAESAQVRTVQRSLLSLNSMVLRL